MPMAGHTGKAFWFSTDTGNFQTSEYYYEDYPEWVKRWNGQDLAGSLSGKEWWLLLEKDRYLLRDQDDRPYEVDLRGYGRTFPHPLGPRDDPLFLTRVVVGPKGDKLLADFAKTMIDAEKIGQGETIDYLAVGFSGVDAVNHFFGPSSLENEDTVIQLDRIMADFLSHVDDVVGLENTLIVLSADHGMPEMPEYASEIGYAAGRITNDEVCEIANGIGSSLFGVEGLCRSFFRPSLYLDHELISFADLDPENVAKLIAETLNRVPGVGLAKSTADLLSVNHSGVAGQMKRNTHPDRSGDIYVAQSPYWFMFDKGPVAAMHGSPWRYDTHVPIVFAGNGLAPAQVNRLVNPADIAPTLSSLLGLTPPAGAQGSVLVEAQRFDQ